MHAQKVCRGGRGVLSARWVYSHTTSLKCCQERWCGQQVLPGVWLESLSHMRVSVSGRGYGRVFGCKASRGKVAMRLAEVQLHAYHSYMGVEGTGLAMLSALGLLGFFTHTERIVLGLCVHSTFITIYRLPAPAHACCAPGAAVMGVSLHACIRMGAKAQHNPYSLSTVGCNV